MRQYHRYVVTIPAHVSVFCVLGQRKGMHTVHVSMRRQRACWTDCVEGKAQRNDP